MKYIIIILNLLLLFPDISGRTYYVRENGSNGNCGFSEDDAWANLWYAIKRAPDGSTIDIKGSFPEPSITFPVAKKLTVTGDSRQNTIITAQTDNAGKRADRLFDLQNGDSLLLYDITIQQFGDQNTIQGGAIRLRGESSYLYCNKVDFSENQAQTGGAISMSGSRAEIELCNFFDNKASNGQGGAIYAMTTVEDGGVNLSVRRTTFTRNQALKEGSALRVGCGAISSIQTTFLLENCTLYDNINGFNTNTAGSYASVFLDGNAAYPTVNHTLVNNTIVYNRRLSANASQATYTTGIYVNNNNNVRLFNNIVSANQNCDIQQRTTIAHKISEAKNNIAGKVKLRTSVDAFGDIGDMTITHSDNIKSDLPETSGVSNILTIEKETYIIEITEKSIARDKGLNGYLSQNIDQPGKERDKRTDIGSYEYTNLLDLIDQADNETIPAPVFKDNKLYFSDNIEKTISVYNSSGQLALHKSNVKNQCETDGLPAGVYIVVITGDNRQSTHKMNLTQTR